MGARLATCLAPPNRSGIFKWRGRETYLGWHEFSAQSAIRPHLETRAAGIQRLVLWAVTTLLFCNIDAHGKNISFLVSHAGVNVVELYGFVSVVQYDTSKLKHTLAIALGNAFELEEVESSASTDF